MAHIDAANAAGNHHTATLRLGLFHLKHSVRQRLPGVGHSRRGEAQLPLPGLVRHGLQGDISRLPAGSDHRIDGSFGDRPLLADLFLGMRLSVIQRIEQVQGMRRDPGPDRPAVVCAVRGTGGGNDPPVQSVKLLIHSPSSVSFVSFF